MQLAGRAGTGDDPGVADPRVRLRRQLPLTYRWPVHVTLVAAFVAGGAVTHLSDHHPLARVRMVRALARHHRAHHDPALMRRWNFNFALPLCDVLLGTRWRGDGSPERT